MNRTVYINAIRAREQAIMLAEQHAMQDYKRGFVCDPSRHRAKVGSAWAEWYNRAYARLAHNDTE